MNGKWTKKANGLIKKKEKQISVSYKFTLEKSYQFSKNHGESNKVVFLSLP